MPAVARPMKKPSLGSTWEWSEETHTCVRHTETHYGFTREGVPEYQISIERFEKGRKQRKIKRVRDQVDAATAKWRRIAKEQAAEPTRDSSPMPEHVPTCYVRPRSVALWRIDCAALSAKRAAARAAAGQPPARVYNPNRMAKTSFKLTSEHLIKINYQRDILLDKLKRRNQRIAELEQALADAQAQ